ncbi:MAG: AraC family transcriptional regulator ligand-binding domain-containing protein [Pseudomonadota bacterium]
MHPKTFAADDPAVPMNYPGFVFRALRSDGYEPEALLAGTGLTADRLEDPSFRSSFETVRRFVRNALAVTGDAHLGPKLAARFEPNFIGLPAYAALNAPRFHEALKVIDRFFFLTFPAIEFTAAERRSDLNSGEASIRFRPKLAFGDIDYFIFSSALVVCETLCRAMLRTPRVASRAEMAIREPDGWRASAAPIRFPIRFDSSEHRFVFPAELLNQPLPGADPINHRRLVALCEEFAADLAFETTVASRVVAFLETERNLGAPLAEAAAALGYSERNLRRQLQRSGASYRNLVDQVRERRARTMLADSARPVQAIAYELGFDAPSSFARSFKRWTGATPKVFRDRQRSHGGSGRN